MTPEFHAEVGFWNNSFYAELGKFWENCSQANPAVSKGKLTTVYLPTLQHADSGTFSLRCFYLPGL
jgi:hypothetical protein